MVQFVYDIKQLARRKAERGLTDVDLAKLAGVHSVTVANVLNGRTANPKTIKALAKSLGFDLAELVIEVPAE